MVIFKRLLEYIRTVIDKMLNKDRLSQAIGGNVAISSTMALAIDTWFHIFCGNAPWMDGKTKSLRLANLSTAHLARLINAEIQVEVAGSPRADFLNECLQTQLLSRITEKAQLALVGGCIVFKPFYANDTLGIEAVRSNAFYPTMIDTTGRATSGVFVERKKIGTFVYTRLESHRLLNGTYTITNKAFRGDGNTLGAEMPLNCVEAWAELAPQTTIQNVEKPLFACFRMPFANSIDLDSNLPVSIFADAVGTLQDIDQLYTDYCWEFQSGKRKIYVDSMAFDRDQNGKPRYPEADLYVSIDTDSDSRSQLFDDYTPAIREQNYQNGINQLLRFYEAQTGVSAGTYSFDIKSGAVTATQVISEDRNTYYNVRAIQECEKTAILDLVYALDVYATLYKLAPTGDYEVAVEFGDNVFEDTQTEFTRRMQMVAQGIMKPEEVRAWYLGENEETARERLSDEKAEDEDENADAEKKEPLDSEKGKATEEKDSVDSAKDQAKAQDIKDGLKKKQKGNKK